MDKACKVCQMVTFDFPKHHRSVCRKCLNLRHKLWAEHVNPGTGLTNRQASNLRCKATVRASYRSYHSRLRVKVLGHYSNCGRAQNNGICPHEELRNAVNAA